MAIIKIRWSVPELENVMGQFDVQKVWRSTVGDPYNWVEITTIATRVPLVAGVENYLFDDVAGDPDYFYAVSYFNTGTLTDSGLGDPILGELTGYISISDVRDEGFTVAMVEDAAVARGITKACAVIDRWTKQWFEPRVRTFKLDGKGQRLLRFPVPLIAMTSITIDDNVIDLESFRVYNRHLTQGLLAPDDRTDSRIEWNDVYPYTSYRTYRLSEGTFAKGQQNITIEGIFGYTELTPVDPIGETVAGSQIPLAYGETPELIKYAAMLLTIKFMYPLASDEAAFAAIAKRLIEEKTFDQTYKLSKPVGTEESGGIVADAAIEDILRGFTYQPGFEAV